MISKPTIVRISTVVFICFLAINSIFAQQNVGISETPITPDVSSILEVYSTSKGILIPRVTTIQRNAIATPARSVSPPRTRSCARNSPAIRRTSRTSSASWRRRRANGWRSSASARWLK